MTLFTKNGRRGSVQSMEAVAMHPVPHGSAASFVIGGAYLGVARCATSGAFAVFCKITREAAEKAIEASEVRNRNTRRAHSAKYAADMLADDWVPGVGLIQFDARGNIINGHHRLEQVAKHGKAIEELCVFDLPKNAMDKIDQNAPRTVADLVKIYHSVDDPNALSAASRCIYYWYKLGTCDSRGNAKKENAEIALAAAKYVREGLDVILSRVAQLYPGIRAGVVRPSHMAALWFILARKYNMQSGAIDEFFEAFFSGDGELTSPPRALREKLLRDTKNRAAARHRTIEVWLLYAVDKWLKNEKVTRFPSFTEKGSV